MGNSRRLIRAIDEQALKKALASIAAKKSEKDDKSDAQSLS